MHKKNPWAQIECLERLSNPLRDTITLTPGTRIMQLFETDSRKILNHAMVRTYNESYLCLLRQRHGRVFIAIDYLFIISFHLSADQFLTEKLKVFQFLFISREIRHRVNSGMQGAAKI